jgi:hypothetical protein
MAKLIKCKACGHDVAKSAKVCPSCGKKLKSAFLTRLAILIVVLGVIGAIGSGLDGADAGTSEVAKTAKLGEAFTVDGFEVVVKKVSRSTNISSAGVLLTQASDGANYVNVEWTYKNITDSPKSSWNAPDITLVSPTNAKYDQDAMASGMFAMVIGAGEKVLSDINPQINIKAATSFEVANSLLKESGWSLTVEGFSIPVKF